MRASFMFQHTPGKRKENHFLSWKKRTEKKWGGGRREKREKIHTKIKMRATERQAERIPIAWTFLEKNGTPPVHPFPQKPNTPIKLPVVVVLGTMLVL